MTPKEPRIIDESSEGKSNPFMCLVDVAASIFDETTETELKVVDEWERLGSEDPKKPSSSEARGMSNSAHRSNNDFVEEDVSKKPSFPEQLMAILDNDTIC